MQLVKVTGALSSQETTRAEIEHAIDLFVEESNEYGVPMDEDGLYNQTCRIIAERGLKGGGGDLWLSLHDGKVAAFALTHKAIDVDNTLCFVITCAYIAKEYRGKEHFSLWYKTLEEEAKKDGCKHIILPSSRSNKAYMRKLPGYHPYVVLLKKDI